ncbi:unnamed protein product [Pleuronectes platessa]|uniref:Uncharacterized protein n=1 Tax=Pleuronectes platessa TaxID=8262 RepID=A0A9N7YKX0_PLEPL|nr:unnamed protein product [Pleuronectes platessa]
MSNFSAVLSVFVTVECRRDHKAGWQMCRGGGKCLLLNVDGFCEWRAPLRRDGWRVPRRSRWDKETHATEELVHAKVIRLTTANEDPVECTAIITPFSTSPPPGEAPTCGLLIGRRSATGRQEKLSGSHSAASDLNTAITL